MQALRQLKPQGDLDRKIDFLREVLIFKDIAHLPGVLNALVDQMPEKAFQAGEDILTEGKVGHELFVLMSGEVSVLKGTPDGDHYRVAKLGPEDHAFFGEGALLDADARSATIRANTVSHCLVLSRSDFDRFAEANPTAAFPVVRRIASTVLGRLRKSNQDLMLIYQALLSEIRGR